MLAVLLVGGCRHAPQPQRLAFRHESLTPLHYEQAVNAMVDPPIGWRADPLKSSGSHTHQTWVSPTGRTAYGVIHFSMPLPVGHNLALWGFLREMRRTEGEADLMSKQWDENSELLRFVAQGGLYVIRTNLSVSGTHGWACYAGTLKNQPIEQDELELAQIAREHTRFGFSNVSLSLGQAQRGEHP
jgi:hypothetical protein